MLRNGCKEGNVSNLNMDDPFKKNYRRGVWGFLSNRKEKTQ